MRTFRNLLLAVPLIALACTQQGATGDADAAGIARTVTEEVITTGDPVTYADLKIDGMSCEMMCGNAVRKALAALPGVSGASVEFKEGEEADHAIVTYDGSQVTDQQMIDAVQAIHGGAYRVLAVSITRQVKGDPPAAGEPVKKESEEVAASLPELLIPGLIELLSQIVRL